MYTVGVIGNGFIGHACSQLKCPSIKVVAYDRDPAKCVGTPSLASLVEQQPDVIFICVPTPMRPDGTCHTTMVEGVVKDLAAHKYPLDRIVVRSTVPPGSCEHWGVSFMPEFLTEARANQDFYNTPAWIVGTRSAALEKVLSDLFAIAAKHGAIASALVRVTSTRTAELLKYARNSFLATKVAFCNEFSDLAESIGVGYKDLQELFVLDPRVGTSHTQVPGPDGHKGFGGTCFPKDTACMLQYFRQHGVPCLVLDSVVHRNNLIDRPEMDYLKDVGRTVVDAAATQQGA